MMAETEFARIRGEAGRGEVEIICGGGEANDTKQIDLATTAETAMQ
jgi:hypothetical protein